MMDEKQNFKYKICTIPTNDPINLEIMLNEMAKSGFELYSIHEVENSGRIEYNVIFVKDYIDDEEESGDVYDYLGFQNQMERIMYGNSQPYQTCVEIQNKIKEKRQKITAIKSRIDSVNEYRRVELNDEMSRYLNELDILKSKLKSVISPDYFTNTIGEEKITISLSEELMRLVDPDYEAVILSEVVKLRQKLSNELGYIIPKVKFEIDEELMNNEFVIKLRGIPIFRSFAYINYIMYYKEDLNLTNYPENVIFAQDPVNDRETVWFLENEAKDFWESGFLAQSYIINTLNYICIKHVDSILDYSDVNRYIDKVSEKNLYLVENILPDILTVSELKYIFSSLIKEKVSIKDIIFIFEKINDFATQIDNNCILTNIRISLARQISYNLANKDSCIYAYTLNPETLKYFEEKSKEHDIVKFDINSISHLIVSIKVKRLETLNLTSQIILCVPLQIRHLVFEVLSKFIDNISVISTEEIDDNYNLEILGSI